MSAFDRWWRRFLDIRREEWPRAIGLALYFFLVIAIFWILKPVKRGLILSYFGEDPLRLFGWQLTAAQAEQLGKVINVFAAYAAVIAFTWLVRRVTRRRLILLFCGFFAGLFLLYAFLVGDPGRGTVWTFYSLGDVFNTIMVATFWAFANDLNDAGEAERLYGVVGLGGVVGGFAGATLVTQAVQPLGRAPLLLICIGLLAAVAAIALWIDRRERGEGDPGPVCCPDEEGGPTGNAALEGARVVLRSRYLIALAALVGLYEIVSNVVDFQLAATVSREVERGLDQDAFFGVVGQLTGVASIVVQVLVTTYVLRRFGVAVGLLFLPVTMMLGSGGFLIVPSLAFAAFMSVSDNALNYSINQSAREALYTPTSQNAKYKAKAFIDMFVQRGAKVVAVGLNLVFTALLIERVRWLSLLSILLIVGWLRLVRYLGTEFEAKAEARADGRGRARPARGASG